MENLKTIMNKCAKVQLDIESQKKEQTAASTLEEAIIALSENNLFFDSDIAFNEVAKKLKDGRLVSKSLYKTYYKVLLYQYKTLLLEKCNIDIRTIEPTQPIIMPSIIKTPDTEKTVIEWSADKSFDTIVEEVSSKIKGWYLDATNRPIVIHNDTSEIRALNLVGMKYLAAKQIIFIDAHSSNKEHPIVLDTIPNDILLAAASWSGHPRIWNVLNYQFFSKKFNLVDYGYDKESGYFCSYKGPKLLDLTLEEAKQILTDLTRDMLFSTGAENQTTLEQNFANYIGYLLTPLIIPALNNRKTPMFVFRKSQRGTGATTSANVLGYIYENNALPVQSKGTGTSSNEEIRKQITSSLISQCLAVNYDDLMGSLSCDPFVRYITSNVWTDRKLGTMETLKFYNPAMLLITTGNNILISGDMARRCSLIEFWTDLEHPELRKYSIEDPLSVYVACHLNEIRSALVTLVKNWDTHLAEDKIGDFVEWNRTIGGILESAGIPGFQDNRNIIAVHDIQANEYETLLEAMYNKASASGNPNGNYGYSTFRPTFTAADMMTWLGEPFGTFKSLLPSESSMKVMAMVNSNGKTSLSKWISTTLENKRRGKFMITNIREKPIKTWAITKYD